MDPSADSTSSLQASSGQVQPATSNQTPVTQAIGQAVQSGAVPQPLQPQTQPSVQPVGGVHKEQLAVPTKPPETVMMEEVGRQAELEPEVEGWLEQLKQEGEITLPQPLKDDSGQVMMAEMPVQVVGDKIVVPMTQQSLAANLKKPISDSGRWLAEWVQKLKKMFGDRVAFRQGV